MGSLKKKPSWAPNAVATKRGWVDPKSGELLLSVKGLVIEEPIAPEAIEQAPAVAEVVAPPEPEEVKPEEVQVVQDKPSRRGRNKS